MKNNIENIDKMNITTFGKYDIPTIHNDDVEIKNVEFIPFNYVKSNTDATNKGIHFFIDDYQFQRLWNNIDKYINMLKKYKYVCTPDFSTYTDYPLALQIYNHYKKQWIGQYMQSKGIKVIPTVSWSNEESYNWCFDGIPKESVIAISSVGTQKNEESKYNFIKGYNKTIEMIKPKQILFYGKVPDECEGNIINIKSFQNKFNKE